MDDGRVAVAIEIDLPQRRAAAEFRLGIDRADLAIPFRAPRTAVAAEHDKLGRIRVSAKHDDGAQERNRRQIQGV